MAYSLCFSWPEVFKLHPMLPPYENWVKRKRGSRGSLQQSKSLPLRRKGIHRGNRSFTLSASGRHSPRYSGCAHTSNRSSNVVWNGLSCSAGRGGACRFYAAHYREWGSRASAGQHVQWTRSLPLQQELDRGEEETPLWESHQSLKVAEILIVNTLNFYCTNGSLAKKTEGVENPCSILSAHQLSHDFIPPK